MSDLVEAGHGLNQLGLSMQWPEAHAELRDDLVERVEEAVAEVILPQVFPEVLDRIQFRAVGRQREQLQGGWHPQIQRRMPSGPIQHHPAVVVAELGGRACQEQGHGLGIDPGQRPRAELAVQGAHRRQSIDELAHDWVADHRPKRQRRPAAPLIADAAQARFVLKQQPQPLPRRQSAHQGGEDLGEFFLNRPWARWRACGWRGRGPSLRQP